MSCHIMQMNQVEQWSRDYGSGLGGNDHVLAQLPLPLHISVKVSTNLTAFIHRSTGSYVVTYWDNLLTRPFEIEMRQTKENSLIKKMEKRGKFLYLLAYFEWITLKYIETASKLPLYHFFYFTPSPSPFQIKGIMNDPVQYVDI